MSCFFHNYNMNYRFRMIFAYVVLFFTFAPSHAEKAQTAKQSAKPNEVIQVWSSWAPESSSTPLVLLSRALEKDETSRRFRVTWSFVIAQSGANTTALYDREKHTLKLYSNHYNEYGNRIIQYLMSQVSDKAIHELAKKYEDDDGGIEGPEVDELAFFARLTEFGAQQRIIENKMHYYSQ